jgi:hypothetical protein
MDSMQIDFIKDDVAEAPFIRIFDLSLEELATVRAYTVDLANGRATQQTLASQEASELPEQCRLTMTTTSVGVTVENRHSFRWGFRPTQWKYVGELIQGVMEAENPYYAHQWLAGSMATDSLAIGEISVLISPSQKGEW